MHRKQKHVRTRPANVRRRQTMSIAVCIAGTPRAAARQIVAAVIAIVVEWQVSRFVVRAFCFHGHELIFFDNVGGEVVTIDTARV